MALLPLPRCPSRDAVATDTLRVADGTSPAPVGLRQIAALCGASRSTVALALKDSPRVTPLLKAKIQEVARRLGYAPNPHVSDVMRSIARGRWQGCGRTVAIVVDRAAASAPGVNLLCRALQAAGESAGAAVCLLQLRDANSTDGLARIIEARRISGAVLLGFQSPLQFKTRLANLPLVAVGLAPVRAHPVEICHDRGHAIQVAEAAVQALGFARPFLVAFAANGTAGGHETLGGLADVSRLGGPDRTAADLGARVSQWIATRHPDVILGFGEATQSLLGSMGCRLPYVDLEYASSHDCLAAVIPDFDGMAGMAVDAVMTAPYWAQEGRAQPSRTILVPGRIQYEIGCTSASAACDVTACVSSEYQNGRVAE